MTSVEEELQLAEERLQEAEQRFQRFSLGIPDYELYRQQLKNEANNIQTIIERLTIHGESTEEEYHKKLSLLENIKFEIQDLLEQSNENDALLDQTNKALNDLITLFKAEIEKQDKIRELEKETLDNINDYIRKNG